MCPRAAACCRHARDTRQCLLADMALDGASHATWASADVANLRRLTVPILSLVTMASIAMCMQPNTLARPLTQQHCAILRVRAHVWLWPTGWLTLLLQASALASI